MNEPEGGIVVSIMEVIIAAHTAYRLQYHVVWVCKYRRRILKPGVRDYLHKVLLGLLRRMPGVEIETIGFDGDHLHMVMVIPPKYAIADVMGQLKSQSSSIMRKKFDWLDKVYWKENIVWSPGYFVSSVGVDEQIIKRYVEYQGQQDSGQLRQEL
jgi:putative transposase